MIAQAFLNVILSNGMIAETPKDSIKPYACGVHECVSANIRFYENNHHASSHPESMLKIMLSDRGGGEKIYVNWAGTGGPLPKEAEATMVRISFNCTVKSAISHKIIPLWEVGPNDPASLKPLKDQLCKVEVSKVL